MKKMLSKAGSKSKDLTFTQINERERFIFSVQTDDDVNEYFVECALQNIGSTSYKYILQPFFQYCLQKNP